MSVIEKYELNNQMVWRGYLNKVGSGKHKNMPRFVVRPLNKADASEMEKLSQVIYRHLNKEEECFIHKHDKKYYDSVFDDKSMHYIGVFVGGQLVGMSYVRVCEDEKMFNSEIPNSPINFFEKKQNLKAAALGADSVHPLYRGNGLNKIMIDCRIEYAKKMGCSDVFSIIDRANHWNMPPYFSRGFNMYATAIDPIDGGKIALMHNDLKKRECNYVLGIRVPYNRYELIDKMLTKDYVGNEFDVNTGYIKFVPYSGFDMMNKKLEIYKNNRIIGR